jgi:alpha-beta hydrolase superfamily lysophospholipase
LFALAATGIVFYLALAPIFGMQFYNVILFQPMVYPEGNYEIEWVAGVKRKEVYFRSAGGRHLHGWYFQHKNPSKTVLVNHGNGGNLTNRLYIAQHLLQAGCSVLLYDYQGYGRSEGAPSLGAVCADAIAAYKYLTKDLRILPADIVLYGESLGTGVTCEILHLCPCSGVVLNSSFYSLEDISRRKFSFLNVYPSWMFPTPSLNSARVVRKPHPPLLMLHGIDDTLCLVAQAKSLFEVASEPKKLVLMAGVGHNGLATHPDFDPAIRSFLASLAHSTQETVSDAVPSQ